MPPPGGTDFRALPNIQLFDNFIPAAQGEAATDPNSD
jgi:hypothetical protein